MKKRMSKQDWFEVVERSITDNGLSRYSGYSSKELEREFNRISGTLYKIFDETELKFRGKHRTTDIYAETYRLMMGFDTSTRPYFNDDLEFKSPVEFEKLYVLERLERMAGKYEEVQDILTDYVDGKISLDELNKRIKEFKETNEAYIGQRYR